MSTAQPLGFRIHRPAAPGCENVMNPNDPNLDPGMATAAEPPGDASGDELSLLRREVQELRDKNLRLVADQRNLQQRLTATRSRRCATPRATSPRSCWS